MSHSILLVVNGNQTLASLGAAFTGLDRLVRELGKACGSGAELVWTPYKIDADQWELSVQLDPAERDSDGRYLRAAETYLDTAIALIGVDTPPSDGPVLSAARALLAASPPGRTRYSLAALGVWIDIDLNQSDRASAGLATASISVGGPANPLNGGAEPYLDIATESPNRTIRCYLNAEQAETAQPNLSSHAHGALVRDARAPGGIAIRPVETFHQYPALRCAEPADDGRAIASGE